MASESGLAHGAEQIRFKSAQHNEPSVLLGGEAPLGSPLTQAVYFVDQPFKIVKRVRHAEAPPPRLSVFSSPGFCDG
jgi:hypothetical protein